MRIAPATIGSMIVASAVWATELAAGGTLVPEAPTYSRDVALLFQLRCEECHRPGQIAPMSLQTYDEARPWAKSILKEVSSKRMPPFYAAGPIGHWRGDLRLTDAEIETVKRWVEQGAVEGDREDLPIPREWPDHKWKYGEPDRVIDFPSYAIPASNNDEYVNLYAFEAFEETTWLSNVQFVSVATDTVHHAHVFAFPKSMTVPEDNISNEMFNPLGYQTILTWLPGLTPEPLPQGQAHVIEEGARLAIVCHFAPRTEPFEERLQIGIYHANGIIDSESRRVGRAFNEISIPPMASDYTLRGVRTFQENALVTHFWVHMHVRGKSSRIFFHYPDGTSETAFALPKFSFDWQRFYYLTEPKFVPKGTEAEFVAIWDNSEANPANPDPNQTVHWGWRTIDEMYGASVFYTPEEKLENPVRVKDGRLVERTATVQTSE